MLDIDVPEDGAPESVDQSGSEPAAGQNRGSVRQ